MNLARIAIVIPDALHTKANAIAAVFDPDAGGAATFSIPCSPTGNLPVTHWLTCTPVEEQYLPIFADHSQLWPVLQYLAANRNRVMEFDESDVIALTEQAVYSEDSPTDVLASLGLVVIPPPGGWPEPETNET